MTVVGKIATYQRVALAIVKAAGTIKRGELITRVEQHEEVKKLDPKRSSISAIVYELPISFPNDVKRIARGILGVATGEVDADDLNSTDDKLTSAQSAAEERLYEPFAEFLVDTLEECVRAFPVGKMRGNGKWGNPDVIGVNRPLATHSINFPYEIVCAEIKADASEFVTAFGQAVAYRLFSHRCYLVIPRPTNRDDTDKLVTQCDSLGIGLVFVTPESNPIAFDEKVRARSNIPDVYYMNQLAEALKKYAPDVFNEIFPR